MSFLKRLFKKQWIDEHEDEDECTEPPGDQLAKQQARLEEDIGFYRRLAGHEEQEPPKKPDTPSEVRADAERAAGSLSYDTELVQVLETLRTDPDLVAETVASKGANLGIYGFSKGSRKEVRRWKKAVNYARKLAQSEGYARDSERSATVETEVGWYYAVSAKPRMEQVVFSPGVVNFAESNRQLLLTALYLRVYQSYWMCALLKVDNEDHPAILIKADDSTAMLRDHPLRIGLSFIHGDTGNLFASFVDFDAPAPPRCPFAPLVVFEDILGLDFEENRERLRKHLNAKRLHIWLAEGGSATVDEATDSMSADPVQVKYEATIDVEPACRAKLNSLVKRHLNEHLKIGSQRWDCRRSFQEFSEHMPVAKSPVLDRLMED